MQFWLDQPIKITKKMIHQVTIYPMLNKCRETKTLAQVKLTKKTLSKWDGKGMKLNSVSDMEFNFGIHVIAHKIYSLSKPNNVPCEAIDLAYKVVKNNLQFILTKL